MLFREASPLPLPVPASSIAANEQASGANAHRTRHRDGVRRARGIAALSRSGVNVTIQVVNDQGAALTGSEAEPLRTTFESWVRELAESHPSRHAKRTLRDIAARKKSDAEQVDDLLARVQAEHLRGDVSAEELADLHEEVEGWLSPTGKTKVELLFERIDLDRVPGAFPLLLLAATRRTRSHFERRDSFIARLRAWMIARGDRTIERIDAVLKGLRE